MLCCGHHSSRRPSANAKHFEPKQNGVLWTSLLLGDGSSWIKNGELQTSSLLLGDGSGWIKNEVLQTSSSLLLGAGTLVAVGSKMRCYKHLLYYY